MNEINLEIALVERIADQKWKEAEECLEDLERISKGGFNNSTEDVYLMIQACSMAAGEIHLRIAKRLYENQ